MAREDLESVATELGIPLSLVFHSATFYRAFSFTPRGRHTVRVCMGTACHIRGGEKLLEKLPSRLSVQPGETTKDRLFTLETVHCVGACSMSPVIQINATTRGRLRADRIDRLIRPYLDSAETGSKGNDP
jgi:NADH-quinone oxidoreductase subunit E